MLENRDGLFPRFAGSDPVNLDFVWGVSPISPPFDWDPQKDLRGRPSLEKFTKAARRLSEKIGTVYSPRSSRKAKSTAEEWDHFKDYCEVLIASLNSDVQLDRTSVQ